MFERIRKWLALRSYRANLGRLLVERYGREPRYTPPQVLTTIKLYRFSERYAAYACAMFCSKRAYESFAAATVPYPDASITPLTTTNVPIWAGDISWNWPAHGELVSELNHSHGHSGHDSFGAGHHVADHSGSFDGHHDTGATSHHATGGYHGGGHDGGGGHGSY